MPLLREEIVPGEGTFAAAFRLRDGGITYFENKLVLAESREEAGGKALEYLSDFFGRGTEKLDDGEFVASRGCPIVELSGVPPCGTSTNFPEFWAS